MKIRKDDIVQIICGKDRGKKGKVLRLLPTKNKLVVEGANLLVKHVRPKRQGEKGQRVRFPAPLAVSNIKLICPKCGKPTSIGYKFLEDKTKKRICKKCKEVI